MMLNLIFSCIGAFLYRLGGTSVGTKWRDLGVPVVSTGYMLILGPKSQIWGPWGLILAYILAFGALFGSLTTYWKPSGEPAKLWNWALTGLFYGLSAFPIAIVTGNWIGFIIRCATLIVWTCLWSEFISWAWFEEMGRGFAIISSIPLLLI